MWSYNVLIFSVYRQPGAAVNESRHSVCKLSEKCSSLAGLLMMLMLLHASASDNGTRCIHTCEIPLNAPPLAFCLSITAERSFSLGCWISIHFSLWYGTWSNQCVLVFYPPPSCKDDSIWPVRWHDTSVYLVAMAFNQRRTSTSQYIGSEESHPKCALNKVSCGFYKKFSPLIFF